MVARGLHDCDKYADGCDRTSAVNFVDSITDVRCDEMCQPDDSSKFSLFGETMMRVSTSETSEAIATSPECLSQAATDVRNALGIRHIYLELE